MVWDGNATAAVAEYHGYNIRELLVEKSVLGFSTTFSKLAPFQL